MHVESRPTTFPAAVQPLLLIVGFALALGVRLSLGGPQVASASAAGWVFAAGLVALSLSAGLKTKLSKKVLAIGLVGSLPLLAVPVLQTLTHPGFTAAGNFPAWAVTIVVVAGAEEAFLRGALYDAVSRRYGPTAANWIGALLFAGLHVPLYGWQVLPLDLVVGLWLGWLRQLSGSWLAPGLTHIVADLASWWLI